ncbi:MAG: hypothetical protein E6K58_11465 [Nitrospirae bacterium]|nr:MAG: hypothetical protein E6K58_11465 [Nitrospirota bacterium]
MRDRTETMKQWLSWMELLDRWGYITAGFSLLILGMLIFANSWYKFAMASTRTGFLPAGLQLLNDLLLVIIILELFRTVVRFLQTEVLTVEPYLAVGIIACTRRILTASAPLASRISCLRAEAPRRASVKRISPDSSKEWCFLGGRDEP